MTTTSGSASPMASTASAPLADSATTTKPSRSSMFLSIRRTWSTSSTSITLIGCAIAPDTTTRSGALPSPAVNLASIVEGKPDDAVAIVSRGKATTYGELERQVASLRGGLQRLGVQPGDRVVIACANNRYFVVSFLATL